MERTFYSDTPRQVLDTLDTDPDQGLTQGEGARRLAGYGENKLEKAILEQEPNEQLRYLRHDIINYMQTILTAQGRKPHA